MVLLEYGNEYNLTAFLYSTQHSQVCQLEPRDHGTWFSSRNRTSKWDRDTNIGDVTGARDTSHHDILHR